MARELVAVSNYWRTFGEEHARSTSAQHPQCQVLRTLNKEPIGKAGLARLLKDIEEKMAIQPGDEVLDLCCGNGWITTHLASKCKHVIGVDFVQELIDQIDLEKYPNISTVLADAREVEFEEKSFDKVIIYAGIQYLSYKETDDLFNGIQYLSYKETDDLFNSIVRWLTDGGILFIGDIPNQERIWNFFNTNERAQAYFDSIRNEEPILGTWFSPQWLAELGKQAGFQGIEILSQHDDLPGSHYRFDMALKKEESRTDV